MKTENKKRKDVRAEKNARRPLEKGAKKREPEWFRLLFFALFVPLGNEIILGTLRQICRYFGGMYSFSTGGQLLFVGGELIDVLFNVVLLTFMIAAFMTVGCIVVRLGVMKGILAGLLYLCCTAAAGLVRIGIFALLVTLGVNDRTEGLSEQLPAGMATFAFTLLVQLAFVIVLLIAYAIVRKAAKNADPLAHARTPFMIVSYCLAALYAALLFYDAIRLAAAYEAGENLFTGAILPFVYPLIYTALMIVAALLYRERFKTENAAGSDGKRGGGR